ncbi:MAG: flagellin [Beijerinckiaceae bacterium]|nr:flagellin [Beijerinckiaceae bacterium]
MPHSDLADQAKSFLEKVKLFGNTAHGGRYVFSGSNGDQPALRDFLASGSAARTALSESFSDVFSMSPGDPSSLGISSADMKSWLDTGFPALFDSDKWTSVWSASSGSPVEARIGDREVATIPAAVSDPALRKVVMASVLMLEFGQGRLGSEAFAEVLRSADAFLDEGIHGLIGFEASNGRLMSRLESAGEASMLQKQIYSAEVSQMVEVDPAEVSLRIESLRVRLEASYAATARLSRLSLVNYI